MPHRPGGDAAQRRFLRQAPPLFLIALEGDIMEALAAVGPSSADIDRHLHI